MSGGSVGSWAPRAGNRTNRDFVRENKEYVREDRRQLSTPKPVLWKPVKLNYPDPSHLRLARATAYRQDRKDRLRGIEKKRCGLTEPRKPWQICGACHSPRDRMYRTAGGGGFGVLGGAAAIENKGGYFDEKAARSARKSRDAAHVAKEKQIQTDEIKDKAFLSQALKGCDMSHCGGPLCDRCKHEHAKQKKHKNSDDTRSISTKSTHSARSNASQRTLVSEAKSIASRRSQLSRIPGGRDIRQPRTPKQALDAKSIGGKSLRSNASIKSNRTVYPDGRMSQCVQTDDYGSYGGISEHQRAERLYMAQQRYRHLVDEYNRMPVSTPTLRVRNRKIEIERAMDEAEAEMRVCADPLAHDSDSIF